jgi:hypothetical protein
MGPDGWWQEDCSDEKRLHIEMGKLADELEQERKKNKTDEEDDSPRDSG